MAKIHRVAVVLETYSEHGRGIVRGVANYVEQGRPWELHASPLGKSHSTVLKAALGADGIITWPYLAQMEQVVRRANIPTVAVNHRGKLPVPEVRTNPDSIVAMAVDHFLAQGFRQFAFYGASGARFSMDRGRAFKAALASRGYACFSHNGAYTRDTQFQWNSSGKGTIAWLHSLPTPIAILAANDMAGQSLLLRLREAQMRVPDEVAVLGVDNDELVCRLAMPPMSSIDIAGERIGYQAAALLDRLLKGEKLGATTVLIDPERLIVRQSSNVLAVANHDVAEAVKYIRENASVNLSVDDVLRHVPVARRTLEMAFRKTLGRSIHEEIAESRVRRAKQLLVETDQQIDEIAESSGFVDRSRFNKVFRERTGHSPAAYRRAFRKPG